MKHLVSLAAVACSILVAGCGDGGPSPADDAKRVELAKSFRSYFDKAGGDYSKLSAEDKAAFVKLSGSEAQAEQHWNNMKYGPGAANRGTTGQ